MIGYRTHRRKILLGVSATTYLVLVAAFGIHLAFSLVVLAAVVVGWWKLCVRFPLVAWATLGFFEGLLGKRGGDIGGARETAHPPRPRHRDLSLPRRKQRLVRPMRSSMARSDVVPVKHALMGTGGSNLQLDTAER